MAIAIDHTSADWGDTTPTLTSTSYTPGASGHLAVIFILHTQAAASIADATGVTGSCIGTATKHITRGYSTSASPTFKVEIWSALTTGSAGTITIALPGTPTGMRATLTEFTGVDTAQGTNGVITTNTASGFTDANSTAAACTLAAFSNSANGAVSVAGLNNQNDFTTVAGWSRISGANYATPSACEVAYWSATNNTAVAATAIQTGLWGVVAAEIAGLTESRTTIPGQFDTRDL